MFTGVLNGTGVIPQNFFCARREEWYVLVATELLGFSRRPGLQPFQKRRGDLKGAGVMPAPFCLSQSSSGIITSSR
jgi:hypothetical protein